MNTQRMIEDYLSALPKEQAQMCRQLHEKVVKSMHGVNAIIHHNALGYSTSSLASERVVYIAPQRSWINLGFFFGSDIPDPEQLLIGQGKRMRHIKIKALQEVDNPAIDAILKAVWAKAETDIGSLHIKKK